MTPSLDPKAVPINGATVRFTYRVSNTTANPAYYRGLTDTLCASPGIDPDDADKGGLKTDGVRWWIPAKASATFSCDVLVTQNSTAAATATFDTSVEDTAAPTASVVTVRTPLAMASRPCDTLWYSSTSTPLGAPVPTAPGTIGRVDSRKGARTFTPVYRIGALAGGTAGTGSAAFAVDPSRPHSAYFVGDSAGVTRGLFHLDLRTGATTKVTGVSPATGTTRLTADKTGRVWSWATNGHLYSLEPGADSWTERRLTSITDVNGRALDVSSFQAGDIAVGGNGGLWMVAGDQITRRTYVLSIPAGDVAKEGNAGLEATVVGQLASPPTGGYDNGIDFGADGYLYTTTGPNTVGNGSRQGVNQLYRIDPATGSRTVVGSMPSAGIGSVADLGSCALPRAELAVRTTTSTEASSVTTGDRITYTVRVASTGRLPSVRVRLADVIPEHTRYVPRSTTLNGVAVADVGGAMPYTLRDASGAGRTEVHSPGARPGVVAGGKSAVVRFTVEVGDVKGVDAISHQPVVHDKARAFRSDDPTRPGQEDPTVALIARPRVQVTQSVDSSSVTGSGAATYVAVVRNVGTEPLAGVSLDGTTTAKRGENSAPIADDTCAHPTLRRSSDADGDGLLDVGEAWVYTCTQPIRWGPGDPDAWTVSRTVSTTAAGGVSSDVADATTEPVETAVGFAPAALDVAIERGTVVGPDSATGRLEATYTVRVRNTGQKDTTYAPPTFTPSFAPGLEPVSARYTTPDVQDRAHHVQFGADGTLTLGSDDTPIAAGQTRDYKVAVALVWTDTKAVAPCNGTRGHGLYASVALADEKGTRRNNATCIAPTAPPAPRVGLTQTPGGVVDTNGDGRIGVGDTVAHSFVVTNLSRTLTLSDVRIQAPLAGAATCASRTLAVGARTTCSTAPYRLTAADLARGSVTSTARVWATPPNLPARTARAATTTRIPTSTGARPGLGSASGTERLRVTRAVTIADTDRDGLAGAGDLATHTFTVTNAGTATVRAVAVDAPDLGVHGASCTNADVRPGARVTCRVVAPLGQEAVDAGTLRDTATITARHAGRPVTATTTTRVDLLRSTPAVRNALRLTSVPGGIIDANASGAIDQGDLIRYAFSIRNTGTQTLKLLQVRDAGLPNVLSQANGTCTQSVLAPGETTTCLSKLGHVVTAADVRAGGFTNAAVAVARDPRGRVVASSTAHTRKVIPNTPKVVLEPVPGSVADVRGTRPGDSAGDLLAYHYLVRNVGGVPITDIRLTDAALGLDSSPCSTGIAGPAAPLMPGATRRCGVANRYVVTQKDVDARRVVRASRVTVAGPDGRDRTSTATPVVTTLTPRPGVSLAVTHEGGDTPRRVGQKLRFRYTVTNTGSGTLSSMRIVDPRLGIDAPCTTAQATLASAGGAGPRRLVCGLVGEHVVTREDVAGGRVQTDVEVVAAAGLGVVRAGATHVVPTVAPAVAVRLDSAGAAITDRDGDRRTGAGDVLDHRFTVTNTGDLPVSVTSLTDRVLRASGAACPAVSVAPGESVSCRLTRVLSAADVRAGRLATDTRVSVRAGRRSATARFTHAVLLTAEAPLTARQRATMLDSNGNGFLDANERATFTVTVTNTTHRTSRPRTFTRVVVDDPMFVGVPPTCRLPKGGLAPGRSVTCSPVTWRTTPQDIAAGAVRHQVTARAALAGGVETAVSAPSRSVVGTTPAAPGIGLRALARLTDSDRDGVADAGETVRYTFLVSDTGTTPVTRPTLQVTLSSGRRLAVTCPEEGIDAGGNTVCGPVDVRLTAADVRTPVLTVTARATAVDGSGARLQSPVSTAPIRTSAR